MLLYAHKHDHSSFTSSFVFLKKCFTKKNDLCSFNGTNIGRIEHKMGCHGSPTCEINFESSKVCLCTLCPFFCKYIFLVCTLIDHFIDYLIKIASFKRIVRTFERVLSFVSIANIKKCIEMICDRCQFVIHNDYRNVTSRYVAQ